MMQMIVLSARRALFTGMFVVVHRLVVRERIVEFVALGIVMGVFGDMGAGRVVEKRFGQVQALAVSLNGVDEGIGQIVKYGCRRLQNSSL